MCIYRVNLLVVPRPTLPLSNRLTQFGVSDACRCSFSRLAANSAHYKELVPVISAKGKSTCKYFKIETQNAQRKKDQGVFFGIFFFNL